MPVIPNDPLRSSVLLYLPCRTAIYITGYGYATYNFALQGWKSNIASYLNGGDNIYDNNPARVSGTGGAWGDGCYVADGTRAAEQIIRCAAWFTMPTTFCAEFRFTPTSYNFGRGGVFGLQTFTAADHWYITASGDTDTTVGLRRKFAFFVGAYSLTNAALVSTTSFVVGTNYHIAVTRNGSVFKLWVNGVEEAAYDFGATPAVLSLGTFDIAYAATQPATGQINDVRFTLATRYTATFTPPANFMDASQSLPPSVTREYAPLSHKPSYTLPFKCSVLPEYSPRTHYVWGGRGQIVGTVKEKATPANTPLRRRVMLFSCIDGRMRADTWSNANGDYVFTKIDPTIPYFITAHDYTLKYNAVIKDRIVPELMP